MQNWGKESEKINSLFWKKNGKIVSLSTVAVVSRKTNFSKFFKKEAIVFRTIASFLTSYSIMIKHCNDKANGVFYCGHKFTN